MKNDFWLKKWEMGDTPFHEVDVNPNLMHYFSRLNLQNGDHILVPLCGKSKDMLWLAEQGLQVIGVELSPIACNEFFAELGVNPMMTKHKGFSIYQYNNIKVFCGDLFELFAEDLPSIQAIYDCKALIALPPDLRKKYVKHLISCTNDQVKMILITIDTDDIVRSPPFPINEAEINALYGEHFNIQPIKQEQMSALSDNLIQKGFTHIIESVYFINYKTPISSS